MDSGIYPSGLDPYCSRQQLLHHAYSPLVSVQATHNADKLVQTTLDPNLSFLNFIKPYGNNAIHAFPNQTFKITNSQLITKTYQSFPIRFDNPLPELLSISNASNKSEDGTNHIQQLFSISSLELLLKHRSKNSEHSTDLYLDFFTKIITSNNIVPFETFNHPIAQIFVIDYHKDTIDDLRSLIVNFRNYNFPKYYQIDDLLVHVFILYDPDNTEPNEITNFQNLVKTSLSISSTLLTFGSGQIDEKDSNTAVTYSIQKNSTIEEDLQRITLGDDSKNDIFQIPHSIDSMIRKRIFEFISKYLIPHMEKKIRLWDDSVLSPKKSITGKFFSVSKMIFHSNSSSSESNSPFSSSSSTSFNFQENYYHKSSQEQIIRKLADWSLMLKDFKYAYSTYDLIKKDYTNEKAWVYVASVQEICIVSLLFAQTQQVQQVQVPDRNTFRKIRHDIIEPYCDNLIYTFKSRFNLKSYGIKALVVFVELLLCMTVQFNNSWWWNDLIEKYLVKCINEFNKSGSKGQVIKALLCERLGYTFGRCVYLEPIAKSEDKNEITTPDYHTNTNKLKFRDIQFSGLTRFRKSSIWYLLSLREWYDLKNLDHLQLVLYNIEKSFPSDLTSEWYNREGEILGKVRLFLKTNTNAHAIETVEHGITNPQDDETTVSANE